MSLIAQVHGGYVIKRRVKVLCDELAPLLPSDSQVLDVGCGDGLLSKLLMERRPDVRISGLDVLVRSETHIPVTEFDGVTIPYARETFETVLFVDVLHHTDDPMILLREAVRVARDNIVIKDHNRNGVLAGPTLRLMDWVGNARHGVALPYNYWPKHKWSEAFARLGLTPIENKRRIGLYPWPASWVFGRQLHFVAKLAKEPKR